MKKIVLILFTVFLNAIFLSCNPELLEEEAPQACCGESVEIPPPPPPPTNGSGG